MIPVDPEPKTSSYRSIVTIGLSPARWAIALLETRLCVYTLWSYCNNVFAIGEINILLLLLKPAQPSCSSEFGIGCRKSSGLSCVVRHKPVFLPHCSSSVPWSCRMLSPGLEVVSREDWDLDPWLWWGWTHCTTPNIKQSMLQTHYYTAPLSLAAQCIVIGPVCVFVAGGRLSNLTAASARAVFVSLWALFHSISAFNVR